MARKMYVIVSTRLIIEAEENVTLDDIISDMDYNFISQTDGAEIVDTEIREYNLENSK